MRFSLKGALAAVAYLALVAAAFATPTDLFTDALWVVSLLAWCYAVLAIFTHIGKARLSAAGFSLVFAVYIACLFLKAHSSSWEWYAASHVNGPRAEIQSVEYYRAVLRGWSADPTNETYLKYVADFRQALRLRAANGMGALASGFLGSLLGLLAFRRGRFRK